MGAGPRRDEGSDNSSDNDSLRPQSDKQRSLAATRDRSNSGFRYSDKHS
jgi:hypothetical protein